MIIEIYDWGVKAYCRGREVTFSKKPIGKYEDIITVDNLRMYVEGKSRLGNVGNLEYSEEGLKLRCKDTTLELVRGGGGEPPCITWKPLIVRVEFRSRNCRGLRIPAKTPLIVDVERGALLEEGRNLHVLHVEDKWFKLIRSGKKTVEGRVYDVKRRLIWVGDYICFISNNEKVYCRVEDLKVHRSFEELILEVGLEKILPGVRSLDEGLEIYRRYYSEFEERIYGVVGIVFSLI